MPGSMCAVETMETFTANSVDEFSGGPTTFSQITRNLLYLDDRDVNKSKQKQGFEESSHSMKPNRSMLSQLCSLSPPLHLGQKGVKIQLLDSSSDSGVCQKNESSSETATIDMETFKKRNNLSRDNSSTSNKIFSAGRDPPSQATIDSSGKKVESKGAVPKIPDMKEIPVLQGSSSSVENAEPSTSRTQSLDAEHLLFHSEQPTSHKASQFPNGAPTLEPITTLEPSSQWLKRLKSSASHSCGIGTKSSNVEEALSHQKFNKLISKVVGGGNTCSSDQAVDKFDGKDEIVANRTKNLKQNVDSSFADPPKEDLDILLSHSWIRRWCRAATQKKKLGAAVVCEPQSTKMDFDELRNKQFPSIGAMALMGEAMNGFQPCEYRRRGSIVLWNTLGL